MELTYIQATFKRGVFLVNGVDYASLRMKKIEPETDTHFSWQDAELRFISSLLSLGTQGKSIADPAKVHAFESIRLVMDAMPLAAIILDRDGNVTLWNSQAERLLGFAPEEAEGHPISIIPDSTMDLAQQMLSEVNSGQVHTAVPMVFKTKSGLLRHVRQSCGPIYGGNSEIIGSICLAEDITNEVQNEDEFSRHQRFVHDITKTLPSIVAVFDLAHNSTSYMNRSLLKQLGYDDDGIAPISGARLFELMNPNDLQGIPNALTRFQGLNDDEVAEYRFRLKQADGQFRWFLARCTVFSRAIDRRPKDILISLADITEKHQLEEKLREQLSINALILEAAPVALYIVDFSARKFLQVHGQVEKILGCTKEKLLEGGMDFTRSRRHPEDQVEFDNDRLGWYKWLNTIPVEDAMQQKHVAEFRYRRDDGTYCKLRSTVYPLEANPDGTVSKFIGTALDITEQ